MGWVLCWVMSRRALRMHRLSKPVDHPPRSVTRTNLEYPTEDVSLSYLAAIDKATCLTANGLHGLFLATKDDFADKAFETVLAIGGSAGSDGYMKVSVGGRVSICKIRFSYLVGYNTRRITADFGIVKYVEGKKTILATESVDIEVGTDFLTRISVSGSVIKGFRADMDTPKVSATDTDLASGKFGASATSSSNSEPPTGQIMLGRLLQPSSELVPAQRIVEVEVVEEEGESLKPVLASELAEVSELNNVPDFLKREAKRYWLLKEKGFTDDEIAEVLGYVPQHQVDLASISWGLFDHRRGCPTAMMVIVGDNPYRDGAVDRQTEYARSRNLRVFRPPRDYREAIEQYRELRKEFPEWVAGKDNWAYQTLGREVLELFQVADTYYGNIVDGIKPDAYKYVPDWEMYRTINMWLERLERVTVLTEERDKHIRKLREVLRVGW